MIPRSRGAGTGATSYFETGRLSRLAHAAFRLLLDAAALLSVRAQAPEPHAEERRSRVSKYEVARCHSGKIRGAKLAPRLHNMDPAAAGR